MSNFDIWQIALVLGGALGIVLILFQKPLTLLLIWIATFPFSQGQIINLGAGIPDITVDRLFLITLLFVYVIRFTGSDRPLIQFDVEDGLIVLFLCWSVFSILLWKPVNLATQGLTIFNQFFLPYTVYFVSKQVIISEEQIRKIFLIVMAGLILISIPTPIEELTGISVFGMPSERIAGIIRVRSFTRSAWEFGVLAGMFCAISFHSFSYKSERRYRLVGAVASILGSLAVFLTYMRGAWLALIFAAVLVFTLSTNLKRKFYPAIIGIGLVIWLVLPEIMQSTVWLERVMDTENISSRGFLLRSQWAQFIENPLLGQGVPTEPRSYGRIIFSEGNAFTYWAISHNMFMSILVDFGLPCLIYFLALGIALWRSLKFYRRLPSGEFLGKELIVALWAAAGVFLIESLTFETRLFTSLNIMFWFILGLLKATERIAREKHERSAIK